MITQLQQIDEFAVGQIFKGDEGETLEILALGTIWMSDEVTHRMVKTRICHKGNQPVFSGSNIDNFRAVLKRFNMRLIGNVKLS